MTEAAILFDRPVAAQRSPFSKVPEVTAIFWVVKVLTTGMGETTSDILAHHMDPHIAVAIALAGFAAAMVLQVAAPSYNAWVYWLTVVMVSVFGTMAADVFHVGLGVPYNLSTPFLATSLAAILLLWFRS